MAIYVPTEFFEQINNLLFLPQCETVKFLFPKLHFMCFNIFSNGGNDSRNGTVSDNESDGEEGDYTGMQNFWPRKEFCEV